MTYPFKFNSLTASAIGNVSFYNTIHYYTKTLL